LKIVQPNETIIFAPEIAGDTIIIDSISLDIEKSLQIINSGVNKVIIKSGLNTVINTYTGTEIWLENLMLISANPSHNCINNYGNLAIKNVECRTLGSEKASILNEQDGTIQMIGINIVK
jgi:hypothetical protein